MYVWLWHHLPGTGRVRRIVAVALLLVVVLVLFTLVFPAIRDHLARNGSTVG